MTPDQINTAQDAADFCEGLINDFESGISTKAETLESLGTYTARIMQVFEVRLLQFSEWAAVNGYVFRGSNVWAKGGLYTLIKKVYTTRELYELFLTNEKQLTKTE